MSDRLKRFRLPESGSTREQSEWLARVDKVAPVIEAHRDTAEHDREMPRAVYEALREAGFTRMWVSREFGGEQVSLTSGMVALEALARLDASVSWQIGVQGAIGRLSDYLPEESSRRLFLDCDGFAVGGVKPSGLAEPVDGGYLLRGEWAMGSGSAHADWLVCTSLVCKDWQPVQAPAAGPDIVMLFVPASNVRFLDTWYSVGLRGTGSNHFQVDEQFVPEELAVRKGRMVQAPPERASRAYPIGYFDFGPFSVAPVALGVAQDALDAFHSTAHAKRPSSGTQTLAANHVVQERFARAEIAVYSARLLLFEAARQIAASGTAGDDLSSLVRLASATVGESATEAVATAFTLAATTSLYATSRLERAFRDVNSVTKHIALSYSHFETVGDYLLNEQPLVMRR